MAAADALRLEQELALQGAGNHMAHVPAHAFLSESYSFGLLGAVICSAHAIELLIHRSELPSFPLSTCHTSGALLHLYIALYSVRCALHCATSRILSQQWQEGVPRFLQTERVRTLLLLRRVLSSLSYVSLVLGYVFLLQSNSLDCRSSWLFGLAAGVLALVHFETVCPPLCLLSLLCFLHVCLPCILPAGPARAEFLAQLFGGLQPHPDQALPAGGQGGPAPLTPAQLDAHTALEVCTPEAAAAGAGEAATCAICCSAFSAGERMRVLHCGGKQGAPASTEGAVAVAVEPAAAQQHRFHDTCLRPWLLNYSGSCPVCRAALMPQAAAPTLPLAVAVAVAAAPAPQLPGHSALQLRDAAV